MRNILFMAPAIALSAATLYFIQPVAAQDGGNLLPGVAQCTAITAENRDFCCGAEMRIVLPPELENMCRGGSPDDNPTGAVGAVSGETTGSIGGNRGAASASGNSGTTGEVGNPGNANEVGRAGEQPGKGGFGTDGVTGKSGGKGKGRD